MHNLSNSSRQDWVSVHTPLKTLDNQGFLIGQSKVFFNEVVRIHPLERKKDGSQYGCRLRSFIGLGAIGYLPFDDQMSQSSLRFVVVGRNNAGKTETGQVLLFVS